MAAAAKVISVQGEAFARSANGTMRRLAAGDSIEQGEVVITSAGGAAELRTADGQMMSINSQESFKFGPESTQATAPSAGEAAVVAGAPAATVIQPGEINVEQLLADEAAAAGLGGGGENGGNSFVRLMRISEELTPLSYVFPNSGAGELLPFEGVGGDDAPVAGADIALADEDGEGFTFREVNPGGDGDVDAPATMTGRMNYDFGNDGPAAVGAFRWTGVTLPGGTPITSGGSLVEFESLNDGLELSGFIMVDGVKQEVFEVVVTNPETGEYTFTLFRPLDHLEQGEDDLNLVFNYQLQDKDGDLANGTLSATINDDTPVADAKNASDTVTVEDEKMQDELGRLFTDEEDGGVGTITGTIVDNAKWGADGFGGVTGFDVGDQHFDPGTTVYWDQYGNFLGTNTPDSPPPVDPEITAQARGEDYEDNEEKIFPAAQLIVNDDGTYTFTLLDNMLMGQDVDGEQEDFLSTVTINAQDGDGDLLNVDINLQVQDDKPELVWGNGEDNEGELLSVTATVDEDDINEGLFGNADVSSQGNHPNDGNGDGSYTGDPTKWWDSGPANVTGSVAALVAFGADGPAAGGGFSLSDDFSGLVAQELTSNGDSLSYGVIGNTLYAYVQDESSEPATTRVGRMSFQQQTEGFPVEGRVVFTLLLESDGTYTFKLYDQLDHEPPAAPDDLVELKISPAYDEPPMPDELNLSETLPIDLSSVIVATDADGDFITLNGNFTINITDDAPELSGKHIIAKVQENDIDTDYSLGTSPNDGNWDGSYTDSQWTGVPGPAVVSGDLSGLVKFGADGEGSYGFTSSALQTLYSTEFDFLGPKGVKLVYTIEVEGDTATLVATEPDSVWGRDSSNTVFELELDTTNGAYEFRLSDELRHMGESGESIALKFGTIIEARDGDNDPVTLGDSFTINVQDDVPNPQLTAARGEDFVQHDETLGNQPQPDDDTNLGFLDSMKFAGISNRGDDPNVAGSGAIGYARSGVPLVSTAGSEAGADHLAYDNLSLRVLNSDSGLKTTEGYDITLAVDSFGRIVGRVDDEDAGAMDGKAAFAIALDQNGEVFVAQYLSLQHNLNGANPDDVIDLAGKVGVRYSMTDTDGDTRTADVGIGAAVRFADDGPTLNGSSIAQSVYEANIDTAWSTGSNMSSGAPNDVATVVSGELSSVVNFGADGRGSFGFTADAITQLQGLNLASWDGGSRTLSYGIVTKDGISTLTATEPDHISGKGDSSNEVFRLELNTTTGHYDFVLSDELVNLGAGRGDAIGINFGSMIQARDGDNDPILLGNSFTIKVQDDAPVLANDSKTIDEDYLNGNKYISVTGNVLDNDKVGADHLGSLKWLDNNGKFGSFDGDSDGSYSYNPINANLQYLDDNESVTETFRYTVKDTDGDSKDATLTIKITGSNDAPTISVDTGNDYHWEGSWKDGQWVQDNDVVYESGLPTGSDPNDKYYDEFASGSFTIGDPDGLDDIKSITFSDTGGKGVMLDVDKGNLAALVGSTFTTANGTVKLTGYDDGEFDYTFTLTSPTKDVSGTETNSFKVTVADDKTSDSATVTIEINDDRPTAYADSNKVTEGATLTVNAADGVLDNDTLGADGAAVNGVRLATYNSKGYLITTEATGGVDADIAGKYGTLHLNADGSYTYDTDPNTITKGGIDTFVYTIRDGDGDLSTTTLKIDVADVTLKVSAWSDSINNGIHDITYPGSHSKDGKATDRDNQTEEFTVTSTPWENAASGGTKDSSTWPEIETAMEERKWIDRDGNSILTTNQPQPITITHDATMTLTFEEVGAGYNNAIGWYKIGATGPEEGQILWYSATGFSPGGTVLPSHTVSVPVEAGDKIGFFLIPNANLPQNMDGEEVTFANGHAFINGVQIDSVGDTDPVWFTNPTAGSVLNSDQVQHAVVGTVDGLPSHELYVGFEDLVGGGDKDYNDFVFKVDLGEGNDVNFNPVVFNLGVDLPDVALSQATIDFTLMDGDTISWDAGVASKYGLTVNEDATTHDVTITANDSAGSVRIEDLLDTFQVTVNNVPGGDKDHPVSYADRTAEVSVMDVYGNLSNEADAIFRLEQPSKEV